MNEKTKWSDKPNTEEDYIWEDETRMKCVCGHIEKNSDKGKNKFILMNEKFHTEEDYELREYSVYMCPKCNTMKLDRY